MTYETKDKWSELALEFKLNEFKQAAEAISCGIQALVPQRSIALFTWDQLERAVCGEPVFSIEDLKKHTIYANWTEQHPVVKRFWKVMEGLDNKDRSQFLRFTWGRSRLPHKDSWPRPFKLCARNYGDDMLPLAHTCFFELELPQYSSEKIMRERLRHSLRSERVHAPGAAEVRRVACILFYLKLRCGVFVCGWKIVSKSAIASYSRECCVK